MKKGFCSCGYLGSVLQKFCKTASIILRRIRSARANAQRIATIAPAYAFTLAEIMIVLVVIGILTGILLPAAFHSMPNENVMKFKKAHNTLYKVINELVNDDKYYKDGDLGLRADGTLIDGTHAGDYTYFCNSIADIMSTKEVNCTEDGRHEVSYFRLLDLPSSYPKQYADEFCNVSNTTSKIISADGIIYYDAAPKLPFGISLEHGCDYDTEGSPDIVATCAHSAGFENGKTQKVFNGLTIDANGFNLAYKLFCIDIDGIGTGEPPFGYGIRVDGKIFNGKRADEWLTKSIQEKE